VALTPLEALLLFTAAALGAGLNGIVGGGTFVAFPALVFARVPTVAANATSTLALWPGAIASAVAYREKLELSRRELAWLLAASLLGGGAGACLLLATGESAFGRIVPWLLLVASLAFTFGPTVRVRLGQRTRARGALVWATAAQLAIATYGGYFGGGMGILMLACWSLLALGDVHAQNALRTVLSVAINGVALIAFTTKGVIAWPEGLVMVAGSAAGGFAGAKLATRLPARVLRRLVVALAWTVTALFFLRAKP
jgi:uncharacterized membrane protein YfcA